VTELHLTIQATLGLIFVLTIRLDTLLMILVIVAKVDLECLYFDIQNAFIELHLQEEIYLVLPQSIHVQKAYILYALCSLNR
jgi:hypothetical protein